MSKTISGDKLAGEFRDHIIDAMRVMRTDFASLSEAEQTTMIETCGHMAQSLVRQAIDAAAESGFESMDISVHQVKINKDTIEAKISIDRDDPSSIFLKNAAYGTARIVFPRGADAMLDLGETPKADPDQPVMFTDDAVAGNGQALPDLPEEFGAASSSPSPAKRKRGRPRKNPVSVLDAIDVGISAAPAKRKRGRPRKVDLPPVPDAT